MRITLLIDIETDDIERLQRYVGEQPIVRLEFPEWRTWGRFIGAKEATHGLEETNKGE
jgi:hypothetical protein